MHSDDATAITILILGYAAAIDRGDLDAVAAYFDHAILRSPRGVARGAQEVRHWYQSVKLDAHGCPMTHHHLFGLDIDVDGDRAKATSFVTVIQHGVPIIAGRYRDVFQRRDGIWRFAEREVILDLVGDLSDHVNLS